MKNLILFTFLILCANLSAQSAYHVAVETTKKSSQSDGNVYLSKRHLKLLALQFDIDTTLNEGIIQSQIENIFLKNPFLDKHLFGTEQNVGSSISSSAKELLNSGFNKAMGTDVTKYADALAQFMIERAKAELTVAFFERFKKFTEEHGEIKTLFPKTCDRIDNLLSVNYRQMLNVLREAFQEDLDELPDHLVVVVEGYADENEFVEIQLAVNTFKQVKKLKYLSPAEFISELPSITKDMKGAFPEWYKNLNSSLELVAIFSNSFRDTSANRNWVPLDSIQKNILNNKVTRDLYLGLVYQQILNDSIVFNGNYLAEAIRGDSTEINWLNEKLTDIVDLYDEIEDAATQLKELNSTSESPTNSQIHSYINTTLSSLDLANEFYEHYADGTNDFSQYLIMMEQANDIYKYVYEKQYSSAILETASLLEKIYPKVKKSRIASLNLLKSNIDVEHCSNSKVDISSIGSGKINENTYLKQLVISFNLEMSESGFDEEKMKKKFKSFLKDEVSILEKNNPWTGNFITFGVFMANMVNAETAEDARAVIEAAALPVGSSALRKNSDFTINVTSYLGAGFTDNNGVLTTISAPIGIDFATGFRRGGSLALNVSLLDIGAIVDYRLADDSSAIESTISLGNIFSPGVQVVYGFPWHIPLSIGWGAQYGPGLTGLSTEGLEINNAPQWRAKAFIAVDMPLFNFYNRQKAKL